MSTRAMRVHDRHLVERLGGVAAVVDPAPALAYELGRAAFALRELDAVYAELVEDSAVSAAGVRSGGGGVRLMSFETEVVSIEVQVTRAGQVRDVLGQVVGPAGGSGGEVAVEMLGATPRQAVLDETGCFRVDALTPGLVRLQVRGSGGATVLTRWVEI